MRIRNLIAAFVASLFVFCTPALAFETTPTISEAQCAIVCDSSGNVLWSMNADREMALASITKVMTAVVALDSGLDLDSPCTISYVDLGPYSQTAGFTESDTPTLRELLRVMLVYSGNDAAVYIAQNVAGSEEAFVTLMNEKARELGMTHTHFANPHGLEADGHYSSVADLVILGRYALENYPLIASTVRLEYVEAYTDGWLQGFDSTDYLISNYQGALGIKTGTVESGSCFLGAARRNGATLYTCVLGCETDWGRWEDTMALLDWGFSVMTTKRIAASNWLIGVHPYAYDFRFNCGIRPRTDASIGYYQTGEELSYATSMMRDAVLVEPGQVTGTVSWKQGENGIGGAVLRASGNLEQIPAFNIFAVQLLMGE